MTPSNFIDLSNRTTTGLSGDLRHALMQRDDKGGNFERLARLLDIFHLYDVSYPFVFTKNLVEMLLEPFKFAHPDEILNLELGHDKLRVFDTVQPDDEAVLITLVCHPFTCSYLPKEGKKSRGAPLKIYALPDEQTLCDMLRVHNHNRGEIERNYQDLETAKTYRQAVYRERIRHRPGQYSRKKLGGWIGVSASTTRRYDKTQGIQVEANIVRKTITEDNIEEVANAPEWAYLVGNSGLCHEANLRNADALITIYGECVLEYRTSNSYSLPKEAK